MEQFNSSLRVMATERGWLATEDPKSETGTRLVPPLQELPLIQQIADTPQIVEYSPYKRPTITGYSAHTQTQENSAETLIQATIVPKEVRSAADLTVAAGLITAVMSATLDLLCLFIATMESYR